MGAPTPVAPQTPAGARIGEGGGAQIVLGSVPTLSIWERSSKPPGFVGDDPKDISSAETVRYRMKAPGRLVNVTNPTATVFYDPAAQDDIIAAINRRDSVTYWWPNDDRGAFWGYLYRFEPQELQEGEAPTAQVEFIITNCDPSDCSEAGPVFVPGTGTASYC